MNGMVYLIGAGPGDPDLLTVKAARAIRRCDVLLVDDLGPAAGLRGARRGVRVIDVGKRGGCRTTPQRAIEASMIRLARRGMVVGRVKGGDPFVFGRGAEEVAALEAAGVRVTVVPGLTAGIAGPAAAGIAVTARGVARGLVLATGHTCDGDEPDWPAIARTRLTIVVYMGVARADAITAGLLAGGLTPATPAAVVENATRAEQRVVTTTLGALARTVAAHRVRSPSLLIVGDVVAGVRAAAASHAA
jgi:uroporphyrin-III C-methyltransferase